MRVAHSLIGGLIACVGIVLAARAAPLDSVTLVPDCGRTGGGAAVASPNGVIYYCAQRLAHIRQYWPGADDFLIFHEVAHIELGSGGERLADCWAAKFAGGLPNGAAIVNSAEEFFRRAIVPHVGYADGHARADHVRRCYQAEKYNMSD